MLALGDALGAMLKLEVVVAEFSQRQTLCGMKIGVGGRLSSFAVNQSLAFISMSAHAIDRRMLNRVFFLAQ